MRRDFVSSCCRVALLGFGTVGSAVARRLIPIRPRRFRLTHIFDRRAAEKRAPAAADASSWTSRSTTCSRATPTSSSKRSAASSRRPTGFARAARRQVGRDRNKQVDRAPRRRAADAGGPAGTAAALRGGGRRRDADRARDRRGLAGDRIVASSRILNGTTNAVLSQHGGDRLLASTTRADARRAAIAEADPSADLDGDDARAKLAILCALAFGLRVDPRRSSSVVGGDRRDDFARARGAAATIPPDRARRYDSRHPR
jgi:homoserine dehydrogenase